MNLMINKWKRRQTVLKLMLNLMMRMQMIMPVYSRRNWGHSRSQSWKQGDHCLNISPEQTCPSRITHTNKTAVFSFSFNRQLLSLYTLSQNPNVSAVDNNPALYPLWVRCDMSDPAGTTWFGAETICVGNKVSGVRLYSVTCKGIAQWFIFY